MKLGFFLLIVSTSISTFMCVDFHRKTKVCGKRLMMLIQNICEHTECSRFPMKENSLEALSTARIDAKSRYRVLPHECCTLGCNIRTIQQHCCGNHSIVTTDTTVDLENVDTSYNEYAINPSMEEEVNRQQREMEAITSQQTSRHRRRHHHHRHNSELSARNIYRDLYTTPVSNEKLKELRKKLLQQKSLDNLEF